MLQIGPRALAERRDIQPVDMRLAEELDPPFGYIPGARHLPGPRVEASPELLLEAFPERPPLALYCMSGRRSQELIRGLGDVGFPVLYNLSGGLLGWIAEGLPVTGGRPLRPSLTPMTPADCERALRSCFVAASVESALDSGGHDLDLDLGGALTAVLGEVEEEASDERERLLMALDRLAAMAWRRGHPLERIAGNMDHMRAVVAALAS